MGGIQLLSAAESATHRHYAPQSARPISELTTFGAASLPTDVPDPAEIVVLIPAHNEQDRLAATLMAVANQSLSASRVVVIADNCTDDTAAIATRHGAEVVATVGNTEKKAGALNQVLTDLLAHCSPNTLITVIDADSTIAPDFFATAVARLSADPCLGAVGGVFFGEAGGGLLGSFQRNEFARYAEEIARRKGRAQVLTGTASIFRARVLRAVAAARGTHLPGRPGTVYDVTALTEDNEMTLAVKSLGFSVLSPRAATVVTEIMPTWGALWRQRLRWQRGALENLRAYGTTRVTLPYLLRQVGMHLGIVAVALFLIFDAWLAALGILPVPRGVWIVIPAIFVIERVWTVRRRGWRAMAIAGALLPEFGYDLFQQAIFLRAGYDALRRRDQRWHHFNVATSKES